MKTWALFAVVLALMTGWVAVQGGKLKASRADVVRLEGERDGWKGRAERAEEKLRAAPALAATQVYEQQLRCEGDGAELFEAGRQTGLAQGAARCPVS